MTAVRGISICVTSIMSRVGRRRLTRGAIPALAVVLGGCAFDAVDLAEKECPCASGFICDVGRNRCVGLPPGTDAGMDARVPDGAAGMDVRRADVPGVDAPFDAPHDAFEPPIDAPTDSPVGPVDAPVDSPPDAPMPPSPSACDDVLAGAIFCDGFEDVALLAWNDEYGSGEHVRVTTPPIHRGVGALRARASPGELSAYQRTGLLLGTTDIYVRGYVYVPSGFSIVDFGTLYVGAGGGGFGLGLEIGDHPYLYVDEAGTAAVSRTTTVPRDTWTCLRAHVHVADGTAGSARIWVNETLAAERTGIDTRRSTEYSRFSTGLTYVSPTTDPPTVYLDDVAVDDAMMPCD